MSGIVPLLETRNLTMRFGGVVAVDDVSFSLKEVELRCLIGPNSVKENIYIAARRKNTPLRTRQIVEEVLEKVRLTDRTEALVGQLSHGQRQWVEIGTVVAGEPELMLLDEPAAGMTDEEVVRTAEIIREINRAQALIVVEHDMQFIRIIAKTVTVFHQGQILMESTIDAVLRDPRVRDVYLGKKVAA